MRDVHALSRKRRDFRDFRDVRGFTLIETMATIVVLAVLGSIASFILFPAVTGHARSATAAELMMELSLAMDRIDRELRMIPRNEAVEEIAPDITSVTPSSITWSTNWSLTRSGTELRLIEAGGTPRILLRDLADFSISAFDESNTPLAATLTGSACDAIRRLEISIAIEREGVSQTLRTKIFLRSTVQREGSS